MAKRTPQTTLLNYQTLSLNSDPVERIPLTTRRYTPYTRSKCRTPAVTKTPLPKIGEKERSRRQLSKRQQQRSLQGHDKEKNDHISTKLTNKSWWVYCVSPLHRFKMDEKSLKAYEKSLNSFLAVQTCGAMETKTSSKRKAVFGNLNGDSNNDYGIEIKILAQDGKENTRKEELVAILCRAGNDQILSRDLISLPVCLMKGPVLLRDSVMDWLETNFGSRVCSIKFAPSELAWLVSLCAGFGEPSNSVELTYTVPECVPEIDTIYFKIETKDARRIWNTIHNSKEPYFTNDEAVRFLKSIEEHFYHHFKIHLDRMLLTTIGTSVAYVSQDGRIKIRQAEYASYILQQLTRLHKFQVL